MKFVLSMFVAAISLVMFTAPAGAQGAGGGKDKAPVVHVLFPFFEAVSDADVVIGPVKPGTTFEIFNITAVNFREDVVLVRFRAVVPTTPPVTEADCLGPASTHDEVMTIRIPAQETVHLTFPEGHLVPAQFSNSLMDVKPDPASDFCLIGFLPNTTGQGAPGNIFLNDGSPAVDGHIGLRIKIPE